jgi:ribonuclease HII
LAVWAGKVHRQRRSYFVAILAGIDEAGLGPVLGPLVASSAIFEVPDELLDVSLWKLLNPAVSKKVSRRRSTIAIADSKKLYGSARGAEGLGNLERGVLAMLAAMGCRPRRLGELLEAVAPGAWALAQREPWNAGCDPALPRIIDPTAAMLDGNSLAAAMARAGVRPVAIRSEPLLVADFNRLIASTNNKSTVAFDVVCRLLADAWRRVPPDGRGRIVVDHQGGRTRYLVPLQRVFDGCSFKVLDETDTLSAYRLTDGRRMAEIYFMVSGEDAHLPVALASMASKYIRELFMAMLNEFWIQRLPGLSPTAGYYGDGQRFFGEIQAAARQLGVDESMLYRSR